MRKFAAVVMREWAARGNLLLPARFMAAAAWIARGAGSSAEERMAVAAVTSAVLAVLLVVILAWFLGATMIGHDVVRLLDRNGAQLRDYPMPKPVSVISQPLPSVLLAARESGQAFLLDLDDGRVKSVPDVYPLAWRGGPLIRGYPASLAERGADIVSINARNGEVTLVERGMRPMREMWSRLALF